MYRSISGPVKFAVIGSGHIGKRHAEMVRRHPEAQLVAMCDILPPETNAGADAFQVPCFTKAEDMFTAGIEIDVVNVCSRMVCMLNMPLLHSKISNMWFVKNPWH